MNYQTKAATVVVIFAVVFNLQMQSDALKCVECGGPDAGEKGDYTCPKILPPPTECESPNITYCKTLVIHRGRKGERITRSCAFVVEEFPKSGESCVGESFTRICSFFCQGDGCNAAPNRRNLHWIGHFLCLLLAITTSVGFL